MYTRGIENIVEYKNRKRKNIEKFAACVVLGLVVYGIVYNCEHKEPKQKGEIYNEIER